MTTTQILNLFEFTALFLYSNSIRLESPDYIMEKFHKYIYFTDDINEIKKHDIRSHYYSTKYNGQEAWSKVWYENENINSIFLYLENILYFTTGLNNITTQQLIDSFNKYVGDVENINKHRYNFVHSLIKHKIYDAWIKKHERELKLIRILE
ncbi:hypothetical protein M0Q97_10185 [Candidatus Dojkabacteria bacterium]|jgi:choline kinase|nr:hypothetical protein [Candidatus Dojkabacteria bacterium]